MLSLILKDFKTSYLTFIFQTSVVLSVVTFGLLTDNNGNIIFIGLLMYPLSLPTTLLLQDQKYMTLCNALPVSRHAYVLSKYIMSFLSSLLLLGLGILHGYALFSLSSTVKMPFYQVLSFEGLLLLLIPIIICNSITFPIFFAFSKERGSLVLLVFFIVLLLTVIFGLVYYENTLVTNITINDKDFFPILTHQLANYIKSIGITRFKAYIGITTTIILFISIFTSLKIVTHKDIGGAS